MPLADDGGAMAARLKLPAYAKRLLTERRAGRHPLEIIVVYGERWWEVEHPKICLKPCDYAPGQVDFHVVAGCRVTLVDQDLGAWEITSDRQFGKFYDLIHELARAGAYVDIEWPANSGWVGKPAFALAQEYRRYDRASGGMLWPRWWSDEIQKKQQERFDGYVEDVIRLRAARDDAAPPSRT